MWRLTQLSCRDNCNILTMKAVFVKFSIDEVLGCDYTMDHETGIC